MNILDWIKKNFKVKVVKPIEKPKEKDKENSWRQSIQYLPDTEMKIELLTTEEKRIKQIKDIEFMVLFKEEYLLKEEIVQNIQEKYKEVVLTDADIQALISIQSVLEYEDSRGDYNIREFIDENKNNIIRLVDKMVKYAKEEAEKNKSEDIAQFVTINSDVIDKLKNEISEEKNTDEKDDDENENEQ